MPAQNPKVCPHCHLEMCLVDQRRGYCSRCRKSVFSVAAHDAGIYRNPTADDIAAYNQWLDANPARAMS